MIVLMFVIKSCVENIIQNLHENVALGVSLFNLTAPELFYIYN